MRKWAKPRLAELAAKQQAWRSAHPEEERAQRQKAYYANPERRRAQSRAWYAAHTEQGRATCKSWRDTHPEYRKAKYKADPERYCAYARTRRARLAMAPVNDFTAEQWHTIKVLYGHRCYYCHRKLKRLTRDHVIPINKGDNHTYTNIVPCCRSCNSRKGNRAPMKPVQPFPLLPNVQGAS